MQCTNIILSVSHYQWTYKYIRPTWKVLSIKPSASFCESSTLPGEYNEPSFSARVSVCQRIENRIISQVYCAFLSYFCIDCNDFVGPPFAFLSSLILFVPGSHLLKMGMDGQLEIGDKKCSERVRKEMKCVISILLASSLPSFKAAFSVLGVL